MTTIQNDGRITSSATADRGSINIEEIKSRVHKETAREILGGIISFLNGQSEAVNSMAVISNACKRCYNGSQANKHDFLKQLAEKYGMEIKQ